MPKARFKEGAHRFGEGLSTAPDGIEVSFQVCGDFGRPAGDRLGLESFLFLFLALRA